MPSSAVTPGSSPSPATPGQNPTAAIALKVCSVTVFVGMSTCIKAAGEGLPPGEIVFFRSAFAIVPILAYLAVQGELRTAFATSNPLSHGMRGLVGGLSMGFSFYGLTLLPLPEAIAIGYASPLIAVVFAAVFLREQVRAYRWTAVLVGLFGVSIISWPDLAQFRQEGLGAAQAVGVASVLVAATLGAAAMILVRRLVRTEKTPTIVLYFSLSASVMALLTLPFGWQALELWRVALLVASGFFGGIGQILVTQSYRFGDVSTIAPFEYTSILLGLAIGYTLFDDIPTLATLAGTGIVVAAGIFIIYRERRIGIARQGARRVLTPNG